MRYKTHDPLYRQKKERFFEVLSEKKVIEIKQRHLPMIKEFLMEDYRKHPWLEICQFMVKENGEIKVYPITKLIRK